MLEQHVANSFLHAFLLPLFIYYIEKQGQKKCPIAPIHVV